MQSNNPILNRVETHADYSQPMTVQGAIQKSVLLTVIAAVVGMLLFFYCLMTLNLKMKLFVKSMIWQNNHVKMKFLQIV